MMALLRARDSIPFLQILLLVTAITCKTNHFETYSEIQKMPKSYVYVEKPLPLEHQKQTSGTLCMQDRGQMSTVPYEPEVRLDLESAHSPLTDTIHKECDNLKVRNVSPYKNFERYQKCSKTFHLQV